jgi:phage terminase large subunit GpA-like protein
MSSAQVGKTEALNNVVAYFIDQDPSPMLMLQPTLEMAEAWSKDRLAPMLRDTPQLRGKVKDARTRDSGNTLRHKTFPGGHITMAGANSPASLASRPIRIVCCDEVDRYPVSAGTEGDPVNLAQKRSTTFWNRKTILTSTPTLKGQSRIEQAYLQSDQRKYWVPCQDCGGHQVLKWANVKWPEGKPQDAGYACEHCGVIWDDASRWRAIRRGEWRAAEGVEFRGIAGFHISELYSPWVRIAETVQAFLSAKRSPEMLKTWVNTSLGETWESDSERIDHHALAERLEDFGESGDAGHIAPLSVLRITCGVDVQADRLEIERVGWGMHDESWSLDHHVIVGDPSDPGLWARLDAYLSMPTEREDGRDLPVSATCVDSGGHHTQAVYRFCRVRKNRRIFAIKGRDEAITVWPSQSKVNKGKVSDVTIVGVSVAKDAVYARLKVAQPGPGYCHFPKGRAPGYFEQLVSEVIETRYSFGRPRRVYILPDGKRNEALDCRVYAFAALQSLSIRWVTEQEAMAAHPPKVARVVAPEVAAQALAHRPAQQQTRAPARNPFARGSSNPFRR